LQNLPLVFNKQLSYQRNLVSANLIKLAYPSSG